jgi:Concanavalin A-like lectin/glucanases superfamily
VAIEPWHGPTVLSLSATHGMDLWDLPAVPFAILAIAVARRRFGKPHSSSRVAPTSALALGVVLLLAGVLARQGGALMPAGGGVLGGSLIQTVDARPVPVGRWTHIALTYDGAQERLYVNGAGVSRHSAAGPLQAPAKPLWVGGNQPWGSHFDGAIDDVRVYGRALSASEVRRDMSRPVAAAPGLAAGYAFDDSTAADASGHGNTGEIDGAIPTRGRHGGALRFDGAGAVVRIPPAPSLHLTRAITLSAWIRPDAPQSGWRTIIQRQTAAYFLIASSDRTDRDGAIDDARVVLIAVAAAWFLLVIATCRAPAGARRRHWWLPVALFALGSLADAAFAPDGTLIGPGLVALWLAATASGRTERAILLGVTAACAGLTLIGLTGTAGLRVQLAHNDGGTARTATLGAVFVLAGIARVRRRSSTAEVAASPIRFVSR